MLCNGTERYVGFRMLLLLSNLERQVGHSRLANPALDLRRPLFVVDYVESAPSAAGNRLLLNAGAQPLTVNESGNLLNMMDVFKAIEAHEDTSATGTMSQILLTWHEVSHRPSDQVVYRRYTERYTE